MQTLSNGYKLPESGDKGSVFFPALEDNITRVNGHIHDGTDSEKIPASSVTGVSQSISSAGWVSAGGGLYEQTVVMPGSITYDDWAISVRIDDATAYIIHPSIEKVSSNSYKLYVNDNTLDLTAVYR